MNSFVLWQAVGSKFICPRGMSVCSQSLMPFGTLGAIGDGGGAGGSEGECGPLEDGIDQLDIC